MASKYEGDSQDLRIVLLGVSGAGKSSIGNALLGREAFKESRTRESEIQKERVEDRNISIIDTPGFFNTHLTDEELQEQMMKSLDLSDPGAHVFLLVISLETFEVDKRNIVVEIEEIFGVQAFKFTMVLFTGRELISKKKWKEFELSENFQNLVIKFRAQYHVINSKNEINQTHIKKLLKKIDEFIKQNDEQHFNNKIYSVSQTRSTKEKKKQEENYRKKEQEKGRQEQAIQETFEMKSAMEEGATVFEPEKNQQRKKIDVHEETVPRRNSLHRSLTFSHEIMRENEVKKQENSWKTSQKKQQTTEKKHPTQAGHSSKMEPNAHLNLMLLGKKKAGKSSSGNTILGREAFVSSSSVTQDQTCESGTIYGYPVTVYDTPGFFDPELSEEEIQQILKKVLQKSESGLCVYLLVIKADSFTEEERKTVENIEKLLGKKRLKKTWILFTRGDELDYDNVTIKEFLDRNGGLKTLVQRYDQRYHVFNNKKRGPTDQARLLLVNILQRSLGLNASEGGRLTRRTAAISPNTHNEPDTPVSSQSSRRIVLVGKTGFGKSASGNTILGQKVFESEISSISVTCECSEVHATVSGRSVSVVDSPGFFDTKMKPEELMAEIARSVYLSSPGPHAFLIVFPVNMRFTEHEQQIPQMIEMLFGEEVLNYSIILFTHEDLLKGQSIEKIIERDSRLRQVVDQCGGRYHVFNNEDYINRGQVNDLLQKIDTMIEQNGGRHYSNEMFEDAERFRQEEEKRKKTEEVEIKQQLEKQRQKEFERKRKEKIRANLKAEQRKEVKHTQNMNKTVMNVRELEAQLSNKKMFHRTLQSDTPEFKQFSTKYQKKFSMAVFAVAGLFLTRTVICGFIGGAIGGAIGAVVGIAGGPSGVVIGAVQGAVQGAILGVSFNM